MGTTTYTYDALGRTLQVTEPDPDGAGPESAPFTQNTYDDQGYLVTITTLDGDTTFQYDNLGRQTKVTLPDPDAAGPGLSPWTVFTFDAAGNLMTETDRLGNSTSYAYDNLYRQTTLTDALSGVTTYAYDAVGNRTSLTDPVGNTTIWIYDDLNRMIEETNELGHSRYFEYDAADNLIERTDRNGRIIEYDYDNLYRPTEERWLDDQQATIRTLTFGYDAIGNLTSASDPLASYTYVFDNLGRNTSITHDLSPLSFDVVIDEQYDAVGRRTSLSATIDGTADFRNEYQYDYLNRMTQVTQAGQTGGNAVADKRVDFAYDADDKSQWTSITRYADLAGTQLVATSTYAYDLTDRLTDLTHAKGANTLADYDWSYDEVNRITQFVSLTDGTVDYAYDDTNQLTIADYDYQSNESHSYDANGNRTNTGYSTGTNNQLLSDGTFNYEYDEEGNRVKRTEIASGVVTEYQWDHRNRLVKTTNRDSETGAATKIVEYTYDIHNHRIAKEIDSDGDSTVDEDLAYIYDGLRHERGNAGDHIVLAFDTNEELANRYLYGTAVDQILTDEQVNATTSAGDVLWPLTDNLGTVRDVAKYDDVTDTTAVDNHLTYDAFGNITTESQQAVDHIFGFTGRERDEESSLQFSRARYYDAISRHWINEDPISFVAGDSNLYRYIGNTATNATDPSGLKIFKLNKGDDIVSGGVEFVYMPDLWNGDPQRAFAHPLGEFTSDEQVLVTAVAGNSELEKGVVSILNIANNMEPGLVLATSAFFGFPVNPNTDGKTGYCNAWVDCVSAAHGTWPGITYKECDWVYTGWFPLYHGHTAIRYEIAMPNGTLFVFYIDDMYVGGWDHIFFPNDIPTTLINEIPPPP